MDQKIGVEIIERACKAPVRAIANNAGFEGSVVVGELLKTESANIGFNAQTGSFSTFLKSSKLIRNSSYL
jgi:chaperonin GroEL